MSNELLNNMIRKLISLFKSKYIYVFIVFIALLTLLLSIARDNTISEAFINVFKVSFVSTIIMLIVCGVISHIIGSVVSGSESGGTTASESDFLDNVSDYNEDDIESLIENEEIAEDNNGISVSDDLPGADATVPIADSNDDLPGADASAPIIVDSSDDLPGASNSSPLPQADSGGGGGFVDFEDFGGGGSSAPSPPADSGGGGGFVDFEDFGGGGSSAPAPPSPPADSGGGGFVDFDDFGGGGSSAPSPAPAKKDDGGGGVDFFDFDAGGGGSSTPSVAPAPASSSSNSFQDFDDGGLPGLSASKEVDNSSEMMYDNNKDISQASDVESIDSIIFGGGQPSGGDSESTFDVENLVAEQSRNASPKSSGGKISFENFAEFGDPALAAQAIRTTLKQDKSEGNS